jgi:phytoene desaturase
MPFEFVELDPLYTVQFRGSNRKFYLYKDWQKLAEQFGDVEQDFAVKFAAYMKKCESLYRDTVDVVIKQNFDDLFAYLSALMHVNPVHLPVLTRTFWTQTGRYFKSKEARQIISLIAFFLGRTPFDTNAIYTLLSYIEFKENGYYNVKGGMYKIVEGLVKELQQKGAKFCYHTEIVDYRSNNNELTDLIDADGNYWKADLYVINSDAAAFRGKVFKRKAYSEKRLNRMTWTMGYLTFYVGLGMKLPQVEHHNYFLGSNYAEYAKNVMKNPGTLEKPYYYVNVVSKHNPDCAPDGHEALFFVCPVPNLFYKSDWTDKQDIIDSILEDFSERIGVNICEKIVLQMSYTPEDWQKQFNLYQGAGLGLSHDMLQLGALRPKNYDEQFKNTFYVGASTIPGAGLPMAIISSRLCYERVMQKVDYICGHQ